MQQLAVFSTSAKDSVTEGVLRELMATAGCAPDADTEIHCLADNRAYELAVSDAMTMNGALDRMIGGKTVKLATGPSSPGAAQSSDGSVTRSWKRYFMRVRGWLEPGGWA